MKKTKKYFIIGMILGGLLFGGIGVFAATYLSSSDISFTPSDTTWKVDNVQDAIDQLYSSSKNNSLPDTLTIPIDLKAARYSDLGTTYITIPNVGYKYVKYTNASNNCNFYINDSQMASNTNADISGVTSFSLGIRAYAAYDSVVKVTASLVFTK